MIELIAGYFNRHSLEYYKWKVNQFSDKTKVTLTAEDYDNLAVAYEKLGRHDKAIETINSKIEQFPDEGRYRSEANLGTFLIHDGQYEAGLQHIERAIEINPNAHFGREVYQQLLVEYVIERRAAGATLPLNVESTEKNGGFARFVLKQRNLAPEKNSNDSIGEIESAIQGVQGMMRFGNFDSPILLEALGDLYYYKLHHIDDTRPVRLIIAKAYLKASLEAEEETVQEQYLSKAKSAIPTNRAAYPYPSVEELKLELEDQIALATQHQADIEANEINWITNGENVDEKFFTEYAGTPEFAGTEFPYYTNPYLASPSPEPSFTQAAKFGIMGAIFVLIALGLWQYRHWNEDLEEVEQERS